MRELELISEAYARLLCVPHSIPLRADIQETLCRLRDYIAEATDSTPEQVQDLYDSRIAQYMLEARKVQP